MEIVMQQPGFTNIFATLVTMQTLGRLRQDRAIEEAWAIEHEAQALDEQNAVRLARILARRRQQRGAMSAIRSSR
jgi:hypothetical protein